MVGTILLANVLNVSAQGTTRKIITEKKTSQGRMVDPQSEVITAPQIAKQNATLHSDSTMTVLSTFKMPEH